MRHAPGAGGPGAGALPAEARVGPGGGALDDAPAHESSPEFLIDLDRALRLLAERDPQLVRVFECRYFGGLSEAETAEALGLSLRSTQRAWMRARAWLRAGLEAAPRHA